MHERLLVSAPYQVLNPVAEGTTSVAVRYKDDINEDTVRCSCARDGPTSPTHHHHKSCTATMIA